MVFILVSSYFCGTMVLLFVDTVAKYFGIKVYELLVTIQYGFKKLVKLCLV